MRYIIPNSALIKVIYTLIFPVIWMSCEKSAEEKASSVGRVREINAEALTYHFVGRDSCRKCHEREAELWMGSDHDLAMQEVSEKTVLGDFNNVQFTHLGVTSRFFKKGKQFLVETEGKNGKIQEFEIKYVFGVRPLQQYLIEFERGYIQVLPLCWDTRPKSQGGQRWFHIYDNERIEPDDILHWTRSFQNWNYMCADCHSTNLRKNYDLANDLYRTEWFEIDVSCEACHGPGSEHLTWARAKEQGQDVRNYSYMGLAVRLKDPNQGTWVFNNQSGNAVRTAPLGPSSQIETCARCHSRRQVIEEDYVHGQSLMQTHLPQLLEERMYFPDGQILDEVYVYGSFSQSKMYHRDVICSDCHEPHSGKVYAQGNALCYRCHLYEKYGNREHHFHHPDSTGAGCADCHMPERTYMVNDPRRDHSIRVPRPDLSLELGTPNSCTGCHADKSDGWALEYIIKWYGQDFVESPHFGKIFRDLRRNVPGAGEALLFLIGDTAQSDIVRATALAELDRFPTEAAVKSLRYQLYSASPLLRYAGSRSLDFVEPRDRMNIAKHLLTDPVLAVRIEAARALSSVPSNVMTRSERQNFENALSEYIRVQELNGDRPASHLNLGVLYVQQGRFQKAEAAYRKAIALEPVYMLSYVNLADLYRQQGNDTKAEEILREALKIDSDNAEVHQAVGFLLTRTARKSESLQHFEKAMKLRPDNPYMAYIYGLALHDAGNSEKAFDVFENALQDYPFERDILLALVTLHRDCKEYEESLIYAKKLVEYWPQ
ncbi:MAG: tetratricopeptide repeat protein, partial [bacterium]